MAERKFQLTFSSSVRDSHELPTDLEFQKLLGRGGFGKVVKCLKKDTNQTVAVKLPMFLEKVSTEVSTMEKLMCLKLDQKNIVQFLGWFDTSCGKAMVFESLDISLQDFLVKTECAPMLLSDVSTIIQQLATAFDALKNIGLIHADLKHDNIMMVDHQTRPFRVKLIDFGLAMDRSKAKPGTVMQVVYFRAPEIMLGLPFSEAVDIWSLACVMFMMLHGRDLFRGATDFQALHDITALLGVPESRLLKKGKKANKYFTRTWYNRWRLKTHQEFWKEKADDMQKYKTNKCHCLKGLTRLRLEKNNRLERVQRRQSINLLKAMLRLDEAERITPIEILSHPFITSGQYSSRFNFKTNGTTQNPVELSPDVILVQPAAAEDMVLLDIEDEINEEPPSALSKDNNIPPDHSSPSPPAAPPGVILVRPAAAENTKYLDDEEKAANIEKKNSFNLMTNGTTQNPVELSPDVILVPPAAAEDMVLLDIEDEINEEPPSALSKDNNIPPDHSSPSPPAVPPGVILVRPAAAENTKYLDDEEKAAKLPVGLNRTDAVQEKDTMAKTTAVAGTKKKSGQKKNCIRRLLSWARKTFGSCCTAAITPDDQGHK